MSARQLTLEVGQYIIWKACRYLSPEEGKTRYKEWTRELEAMVDAKDIRRALVHSADCHRAALRLPGARRYSWADASSDSLLILNIAGHGGLAAGTIAVYSVGGAMVVSQLGGLISAIGILAGFLSTSGTVSVVIVSAIVGAGIGAGVGGTAAGRKMISDVRMKWRQLNALKLSEEVE